MRGRNFHKNRTAHRCNDSRRENAFIQIEGSFMFDQYDYRGTCMRLVSVKLDEEFKTMINSLLTRWASGVCTWFVTRYQVGVMQQTTGK